MDFNNALFCKRFAKLRENLKLSQEELAMTLGVSQQTLSRYEKNQRQPSIDFIIKAAYFFEFKSDYLLGLSDEKSPYRSIEAAALATGLTDEAIKSLQFINRLYPSFSSIFSRIIEDEIKINGEGLLVRIMNYFLSSPPSKTIYINELGEISTSSKDIENALCININDFIDNKLINNIIKCIQSYTVKDKQGHKISNFAEAFNYQFDFIEVVMEDFSRPASIYDKVMKIEKDSDNAEHNTPKE